MDFELKAVLEKKIKEMGGGNYIGSKTRIDENGEHLDIQFKKSDGTIETTTIDFPKPKDGKDGAPGKKGDPGEKGEKGDPGGGGGKDSAILDELEKNRILYYRADAIKNPVEGDRRDTGLGTGRNGDEVYTGGKWVKKIEVGSVGTDMITLRDGLNDLKVKEPARTFNLVRKLKTLDGIQVGSSFSPLALTADKVDSLKLYYPDTNNDFEFAAQTVSDVVVELPSYFDFTWNKADAIVNSFILRTEQESRARLRLYHIVDKEISTEDAIANLSDFSMVYESMPDTEFRNPENKECYGGILIPQGETETYLKNEMYLTNNTRYILMFDSCIDSYFVGDGRIPYFIMRYFAEKNTNIINSQTLEERFSTNNIAKVFNEEDLREGQTGLIIQTTPETYTKWFPEEFPKYNSLPFLKNMRFSFVPNVKNKTHFLFGDFLNALVLDIQFGDTAILRGTCYRGERLVKFEINTNSTEPIPEGWSYPEMPYVPDGDRWTECEKEWAIYCTSDETSISCSLIDPNGYQWQATFKGATHIAVGGKYEFGNSKDKPLKRLWNVNFEAWSDLSEEHQTAVIDETITGIQTTRLVTIFNGFPIDILDPIAIHKYADLTKDFHTFFDASGLYRCFGMEKNLPTGYIYGDNDFYVDVYTTSMNYKCLEATDIRSGRKFIKNMYNGKWDKWIETGGIGSVPLIPKSIYLKINPKKGNPDMIPLQELGVSEKDIFMVNCGTRGLAVRVDDPSMLDRYAASYYVSDADMEFIFYIDAEGTSRSVIEIFKYVPKENEPPKPWHPYLRLINVLDDISNDTRQGDIISMAINPTSWELVREPEVIMQLPSGQEVVPLEFDGKEKYFFNFPFSVNGKFNAGDKVTYSLGWGDQLGKRYDGEEQVTKDIIV